MRLLTYCSQHSVTLLKEKQKQLCVLQIVRLHCNVTHSKFYYCYFVLNRGGGNTRRTIMVYNTGVELATSFMQTYGIKDHVLVIILLCLRPRKEKFSTILEKNKAILHGMVLPSLSKSTIYNFFCLCKNGSFSLFS